MLLWKCTAVVHGYRSRVERPGGARAKTRRVGTPNTTNSRAHARALFRCMHPSIKRPRQRAQRTRSIMSGRLSTPTDFETELQRIPSIKCALVTDLQGVVLLRAGSSTDEAALQQMAATFALTTDQANKLRLGKTKHFTLCYGAFAESEDSCTHTHTASHLTPVASPAPQRP